MLLSWLELCQARRFVTGGKALYGSKGTLKLALRGGVNTVGGMRCPPDRSQRS